MKENFQVRFFGEKGSVTTPIYPPTAFRQIKDHQAKTRVIDPCHRIWLFGVACIIYASRIYRHLPEDADTVIPEELITEEIEKAYKLWMYKRIPVRVLIDQYLQILELNQPLFFLKEV